MLNRRMPEVLQTLEREEMKIEVIFRESIDGDEFLYWFSVQGDQGETCHNSPFDVDAKHIEFYKECIDHEYGMRDAQPQVVMVPKVVAQAMEWHRPWESSSKWSETDSRAQ